MSSRPGSIALTPLIVFLGLLIGIGVAGFFVGRFACPGGIPGFRPSKLWLAESASTQLESRKTRDLWLGLLFAALGAVASRVPAIEGKPFFGYLAALLMIAASGFVIPSLVSGLTTVSSLPLTTAYGSSRPCWRRAASLPSLRRTSVLVGAFIYRHCDDHSSRYHGRKFSPDRNGMDGRPTEG